MRRASPLTASHTGEVVTQKTIMLTDLPRQLGDILADLLSGQPNVTLIRDPEGDLIAASAAAKAKVVVVASSEPTDLEADRSGARLGRQPFHFGDRVRWPIGVYSSDPIRDAGSERPYSADHCCRGREPRGDEAAAASQVTPRWGPRRSVLAVNGVPARLAAILARRWRGDPLYYSARQPYFIMRNHARVT